MEGRASSKLICKFETSDFLIEQTKQMTRQRQQSAHITSRIPHDYLS